MDLVALEAALEAEEAAEAKEAQRAERLSKQQLSFEDNSVNQQCRPTCGRSPWTPIN